jgi:NADH-quinone oxidoreductase subunit J
MMSAYYISVFLAILGVGLALFAREAMHGLLYLLLGLIAVSFNLALVGSGFGAVLLMIVYAGAIMVLFIFVVMLLNHAPSRFQITTTAFVKQFFGPLLFTLCIFSFLVFAQSSASPSAESEETVFNVKTIAEALFRDAWFFVELISLLLTSALIGAFHIGKRHES